MIFQNINMRLRILAVLRAKVWRRKSLFIEIQLAKKNETWDETESEVKKNSIIPNQLRPVD